MRKQHLLILAACLTALVGQSLYAGPVSPGRALEIGKKILEGPATRGGDSRISIIWDGESSSSTQTPAIYVIGKDDGGFVILSADDNARPVLAISENGRFETKNMPENVRWWMERMKSYVRKQAFPDLKASVQWAALAQTRADSHITGTVKVTKEILTPEWDQGNNDEWYFDQQVFNKYCPENSSGDLTITGCVATAMAELLTTLSTLYPSDMPDMGQGIVGGYDVDSGSVAPPSYELTTRYDWAGLRTLTGVEAIRAAISEGKTDLLDNLAHLLADCGAIAQASYAVGGTSAGTGSNITRGFAEHLYTSKTAHAESESDYTPARWKELLKAELEKHPILYSGQSPYGGHAFIFDGYGEYEGEDVFHVNFGWSGYCNGYYYYDNLDTGEGFVYSDHGMVAIFDLYPDASQSTTYTKRLKYIARDLTDGTSINGISTLEDIIPNQTFEIRFGCILNAGNDDYTGELRIWREDKNGNKVGDPVYSTSLLEDPLKPNYFNYYWFYRSFDGISLGDKLVGYYSTDSDNTVWEKIITPADGKIVGEMPLVPGAFIQTESSYAVGDIFHLRIMNYGQPYAGTVWTITDPDGGTSVVPQSEEKFTLTKSGKYKIVAAIATKAEGTTVENVVAYITVR